MSKGRLESSVPEGWSNVVLTQACQHLVKGKKGISLIAVKCLLRLLQERIGNLESTTAKQVLSNTLDNLCLATLRRTSVALTSLCQHTGKLGLFIFDIL